MNSTIAKNKAVATTLNLVFSSFLLAFVILFLVQKFLVTFVDDNISKEAEILIGFLLNLVLIGGSAWLSRENVSTTVLGAIDLAAEELAAQERQKIEEQRIRSEQEYCCVIPIHVRSGDLKFPLPSDVCIKRIASDAVVKALADEDDVLKEIASCGIQLALNQLKKEISKINNELFIDDIYAYLKAWLIFSIRYDRDMPIAYIKQRYPKDRIPDTVAYAIAVEQIRDRLIVPALEEHLDKKLDASQKSQAIHITIQRLNNLVAKLRNDYSNN